MRNTRRLARGAVLAGALLALLPCASASADGHSPCDEGSAVLIQDWTAEGVPGAEGHPARATLECLDDGRIRQIVEVSKDGGATWSKLFESVYAPMPAVEVTPAPAPAAEVAAGTADAASGSREPAAEAMAAPETRAEPAAEAAPGVAQHQAARQATVEGSDVQAVTRELQREEIPVADAPELVMASPMTLEIAPGAVHVYPENAAWVTDETAGFICNQVIVKQVSVARRVKGDTVELIVGAKLYSDKRQRSLDLLIETLLGEELLASGELRNVRVGLNIPGMDKTGLGVETRLELSRADFDRLFADGAEPRLRVTVTSPAA